jgi:GNAT superfamily N-acetyltransferase
LASGAISFEDLPARAAKKLPRHPIPVVLLARLAVAKPVQGQGLGPLLLVNALKRCLALSREVGIYAVKVDAIDEKAARFYKKYGFIAFSDNPLQLYLAMATVEKGFTF